LLTKEKNELLTQTDSGTPMGELFRRYWIPVLLSNELPAKDCPPVEVNVLGEELVAFRDSEGKVGLIDAYCPHRTAKLFWGRNEDCGLRCVYHGWKFDRNGNCLDMPSEPPESSFKEKVKITSYATQEMGGMIWAYMGPKEHVSELPKMEWMLVPDTHRYMMKFHIECNFMQSMEGDIDSSHSAFLHSNLKGQIESGGSKMFGREKLRQYSFKDMAPRFFVTDTDYGLLIGARRNAEEDTYYWRVTQWLMPTYSFIPKEPGDTYQCNMRIPIDNHSHWFFRIMWNPDRPLSKEELWDYENGGNIFPEVNPGTFHSKANKSNKYLIDRSLQKSLTFTGIKGIPIQDQACTESMGTIANRTKERLGTSDTAIIQARRRLITAALQLLEGHEPYSSYHGDSYFIRSTAVTLPRDIEVDKGAKELLRAHFNRNEARTNGE
jgi:phthalate 4,5-dioxygenase oxygenase subunit